MHTIGCGSYLCDTVQTLSPGCPSVCAHASSTAVRMGVQRSQFAIENYVYADGSQVKAKHHNTNLRN